jgi:hypothetical protein
VDKVILWLIDWVFLAKKIVDWKLMKKSFSVEKLFDVDSMKLLDGCSVCCAALLHSATHV